MGKRDTSWIKPQKGKGNYKDFAESELNESQNEVLRGLALENESQHLERRDPATEQVKPSPQLPLKIPSEPSKKVHSGLKPISRVPEFFGMAAVFVILLSFGVRNIHSSKAKTVSSPSPVTLGVSSTEEDQTESAPEVKPKMVVIEINDDASSVNIRKEPSVRSEKIGDAKEGDTYELISNINSKWYEVKLMDGTNGFISEKYIEEVVNE